MTERRNTQPGRGLRYEDRGDTPAQQLAYQDTKDPWTFVASTGTVDRYGDVVEPDGWDLKQFKKNPIALWQHRNDMPIGNWEEIRVEDGKLVARLNMVKAGVSIIADMVRNMIENRVLRAVSVGFLPRKTEKLLDDKGAWTGGYRFLKSELLEISVVSVPANPEALSIAKSMGATPDLIEAFFAKTGDDTKAAKTRTLGPSARSATNPPNTKPKGNQTMKTLAERIEAREAETAKLRDQITELSASDDMTEEVTLQIEQLTTDLEAATKSLETLRKAQAALAASARPAGSSEKADKGQDRGTEEKSDKGQKRSAISAPSTIRQRGQKDPAALLFRSALVIVRSHVERRSHDDLIRNVYGGSADLEAVVKAAVDPAMHGVSGWAAELVGETVAEFLDVLRPGSIFFNVPMVQFTFGRAKIKLPSRSGGSLAGDFVGEGAPIPVKRLTLTSATMEPHKLGVISTFTRELAMLADPAIEPMMRDVMTEDTRETIDGLFLDNTAASAGVRPAGLQNLAGANTVASSGTTLANVITDLKAAIQAMANANMGRRLVWIMNVQRMLSLSLMTNAAGNFMFRDELATGTLMGIPVLASTKVPSAIVFLVDAAELAGAYDSVPQIDVSEQATLHMESVAADVDPISTVGTPNVVAAPVRSLFQTATVGVRLLWDITWVQRRAGAVFTITGVAW